MHSFSKQTVLPQMLALTKFLSNLEINLQLNLFPRA